MFCNHLIPSPAHLWPLALQLQAAFRLCETTVPGVPLAPTSEEVVEMKALETGGDTFEGMFEAISGWWWLEHNFPISRAYGGYIYSYMIGIIWIIINHWLVVAGTWLLFLAHIGNFIIPTDELIFFRMVETTNQIMGMCVFSKCLWWLQFQRFIWQFGCWCNS